MNIRYYLLISLLCIGIQASGQDTYETVESTVITKASTQCTDGTDGCIDISVRIDTGIMEGERLTLSIDPKDTAQAVTDVQIGDRVVLQTAIINGERVAFISDVVRRPTLLLTFGLFVLLTFLLGGLKAMRPFAGMVASLAVLFGVMIPLFLKGYSPLSVGLLGSFSIMAITFLLGHGWNAKTNAAFVGTAISLCITSLLALLFAHFASLTGTADEEMLFLLADYPDLNTRGILLAGIIIGCLGVLDDITISQSSAVFELRKANPLLNATELYRRALRIGSDHIAAAVNTLILAYGGASLPLLLLLMGIQGGESISIFLNREIIAEEIIRTLVGSMGLLLAVPSTTWIASISASKMHVEDIEAETSHAH